MTRASTTITLIQARDHGEWDVIEALSSMRRRLRHRGAEGDVVLQVQIKGDDLILRMWGE